MDKLKLIGGFNCHNCKKQIKLDTSVGICDKEKWNVERIKCPFCNFINIMSVDIKLISIQEER